MTDLMGQAVRFRNQLSYLMWGSCSTSVEASNKSSLFYFIFLIYCFSLSLELFGINRCKTVSVLEH